MTKGSEEKINAAVRTIMTTAYIDAEAIKSQYSPYDEMPAFKVGFADYMDFANHGVRAACSYSGVDEQAYDRGFEAAMKVLKMEQWILDNVGVN